MFHPRIILVAAVALFGGCSAPRDAGRPMDLAGTFERAVHRPANAVFEIRTAQIDGRERPAIAVPATSRITWQLKLPDHAQLQTWLAIESTCPALPPVSVDFRIGISDERTYDELIARTIAVTAPPASWESVAIDLSTYSGFHWSLFYRPREIAWWLVFNTRLIGGVNAECTPSPLWGGPAVEVSR